MAELVLPRPGQSSIPPQPPVPAPSEEAFTNTFGKLLPTAKYLQTSHGRAAYYELPPSPSTSSKTPFNRVLFIHGVQTPALGMLPLAHALKASFPESHFVLVDLWGHGLSETPIIPHEASLFHHLIDSVLDELEWPSTNLVGFSFGGALTVGYVSTRPSRVQSFVLVAPAGLIKSRDFSAEEQGFLESGGDEIAAQKWVLQFLNGGDLIVPANWKERVTKGEVVAEALRAWQMREHAGHGASVVGVFRDGGVMDKEEMFVGALKTGIPSLAVLGGDDDVCSESELRDLGFENVHVVKGAGHEVVRGRVPQVAGFIDDFWTSLDKSRSN